MTKEEELMDMSIGEVLFDFAPDTDVICVPGGWLFKTTAFNQYSENSDISVALCFVPNRAPFTL